MRVLAITNLYPNPFQPHRAPFNRHQLRILNENHPVQVIAPISWTDELSARRKGLPRLPPGRSVTLDGLTVHHPLYWFPPKFGRQWYGHCYRRSIRKTFVEVVRGFRPDLVFAPWAYPDGWAAGKLAHAIGLPVVVQVHGSDILLLSRFPSRRRRTAEAVCEADGVVAVSENLKRQLEGLGVSSKKIKVVYDGVDPALFHPGCKSASRSQLQIPSDLPVLLFVGNLVEVKAVDVLLAAMEDLRKSASPCRLFAIGHGPLRAGLEAMAAKMGLAELVRFVGSISQAELPAWYRAADVFVLPSHSEGVPNVLLEASACGTPWVASRVGGIPEIAHLGASRLVPPGQPLELAAAIRETLGAEPSRGIAGPRSRSEAVADLTGFLLAHSNPVRDT